VVSTTRRLEVAIGPVLPDVPSWNWIGPDTASELSKYFNVHLFEKVIPPCDVALIIKARPKRCRIERVRASGTHLVYMPVDRYMSIAQIADDADILGASSNVILHTSRLEPYVRPFARHVSLIDHHVKYTLESPVPYRENGFALWIGELKYAPYALAWAAQNSFARGTVTGGLVICTNAERASKGALREAHELARQLDVPLDIDLPRSKINGHDFHEWSTEAQRRLLLSAKMALDIKGSSFNQSMKPATKAQKYVASGLPFATNAESYAMDWFRARGLILATIERSGVERWSSREYWKETQDEARRLREELSLPSIGRKLRQHIEDALAYGPPAVPARPWRRGREIAHYVRARVRALWS
jgi:hypothetical protein